MKKIFFPILLFFSCITIAHAQSNLPKHVSDSLYRIWNNTEQHDTTRLDAMQKFIWDGYLFIKPDTAFELSQQQYAFAESKGLKKHMSDACNIKGASFYLRGDYDKAFEYYSKGLEICNEIGYKRGSSSFLNNIGNIKKDKGEYLEAISFYQRSLKISEEINNEKAVANSINNIGLLYMNQGLYEEAINHFTRSLKLQEELENYQGMASSWSNLGAINLYTGNFVAANGYYSKCLKYYETSGDKRGTAIAYFNIGNVFSEQGDYAKAYEYNVKSHEIFLELQEKLYTAMVLNNFGNLYVYSGDSDKAIEYYLECLKTEEEIGDKLSIANTLNGLGNAYSNKRLYNKSQEYYLKSLVIFKELGNKSNIATGLHNLAGVYLYSKDYNSAIDFYLKSIEIKKEIGDSLGEIPSINAVGQCYRLKGQPKKAITHNLKALMAAEKANIPNEIITASKHLIRSYEQIDRTDSAMMYLDKLKNVNNRVLKTNYFLFSEREKDFYFANIEEDFGMYYKMSVEHQDEYPGLSDTAYNLALFSKGLSLKSSTAMREVITNSGDTTLIKDYENWLELKKKNAKLIATGEENRELEADLDQKERELVKKSNFFGDYSDLNKLDWKKVQGNLKAGEAAIEFVNFKDDMDSMMPVYYVGLLIRKESVHPHVISLCTEKELEEILGKHEGNDFDFVNNVYGTKSQIKADLYDRIWRPMEKYLNGISTIYYSPSGLLHKVSFSSLSKSSDVYLSDTYHLNQKSSTGKLAVSTMALYEKNDNFLLVGGVEFDNPSTIDKVWSYLPGTKAETDDIYEFLRRKKHTVNYYSNQNASELNFKEHTKEADIIHVSTHGFFFPDPEKARDKISVTKSSKVVFRGGSNYANWSFVKNKNPLMRSGLVLAGANDIWNRDPLAEGEDGVLTAQEVANMDLQNTKLVVLSACETGLGDIKGSEGVYGLQRAFKIAGAEYIIMSLWQVPDEETSEFMQLFYSNLIKNKNISEAFHLTRNSLRKKYDPYFWAAFVLID